MVDEEEEEEEKKKKKKASARRAIVTPVFIVLVPGALRVRICTCPLKRARKFEHNLWSISFGN